MFEAKSLRDLVRDGCPGEITAFHVVPDFARACLEGRTAIAPVLVRFAEGVDVPLCLARVCEKLAEYLTERTGYEFRREVSRSLEGEGYEIRFHRGYFVA